MAKISLQLHATPEELLKFAQQIIIDPEVHVSAIIQSKPFEVIELSSSQIDDYFAADFHPKRLFFTLNSPVLPTTGVLDFAGKNPDFLNLSVGVLRHGGLEESWLAAKTENMLAIRTWKQAIEQFKVNCSQGATAVNPKTGMSGPAKYHWFTVGSSKLDASGVPLLTATGIIMKPNLHPTEPFAE